MLLFNYHANRLKVAKRGLQQLRKSPVRFMWKEQFLTKAGHQQ